MTDGVDYRGGGLLIVLHKRLPLGAAFAARYVRVLCGSTGAPIRMLAGGNIGPTFKHLLGHETNGLWIQRRELVLGPDKTRGGYNRCIVGNLCP